MATFSLKTQFDLDSEEPTMVELVRHDPEAVLRTLKHILNNWEYTDDRVSVTITKMKD